VASCAPKIRPIHAGRRCGTRPLCRRRILWTESRVLQELVEAEGLRGAGGRGRGSGGRRRRARSGRSESRQTASSWLVLESAMLRGQTEDCVKPASERSPSRLQWQSLAGSLCNRGPGMRMECRPCAECAAKSEGSKTAARRQAPGEEPSRTRALRAGGRAHSTIPSADAAGRTGRAPAGMRAGTAPAALAAQTRREFRAAPSAGGRRRRFQIRISLVRQHHTLK
jgi:hypothetical protein